jgi:hypothetical protein
MFKKLRRAIHERDIDASIRRHGWTAIYVGDYKTAPTWVYSAGFHETCGQPEVVVFDISHSDANVIFGETFRALQERRLEFVDSEPWEMDGETIGVWRSVHPSQIDSDDVWLGAAVNRRERQTGGRGGLGAFQLVLADANHRFPWEAGYDERIRERQPALYLPALDYGDTPLSPPERSALRLADERGWAVMAVDGPSLKWAYTLGAGETLGAELIAFMPFVDVPKALLQVAMDQIRQGDLVLRDELQWSDRGLEGCWRRVHESQYLGLSVFRLAKLRHEKRMGRREALAAYQFFIPDSSGRYPWEPSCASDVKSCQPLLFEPFDMNARGPLAALMRM